MAQKNLTATERLFLETYEPFMVALGELSFQWNVLQEGLCSLFCALLASNNPDIGQAIWHTVKSDRGQREMLIALLPVARVGGHKIPIQFQNDIKDALNNIMKLENTRNDAIHAPMAIWIEGDGFAIKPDTYTNNPRAKNLDGKDLISTFKYVSHCAEILAKYTKSAEAKIIFNISPFPQKPQLPPLSQFQSHKKERRQTERK